MIKEEVVNQLKVGKWFVEFLKVDGTNSCMECTLDVKHIPASEPKETKRVLPENKDVVRVYSMDRSGWRSFRVENIQKMYRAPDNL